MELDQALTRLASATGKSKSSLLREAVAALVSNEAEFAAAVEEGRAAARVGAVVDHETAMCEIEAVLASKR